MKSLLKCTVGLGSLFTPISCLAYLTGPFEYNSNYSNKYRITLLSVCHVFSSQTSKAIKMKLIPNIYSEDWEREYKSSSVEATQSKEYRSKI